MEGDVRECSAFRILLEILEFCILRRVFTFEIRRLDFIFFDKNAFVRRRCVSKIVGMHVRWKKMIVRTMKMEIFRKEKRRCAMENRWEDIQRRNLKRDALKGCVRARINIARRR